MSKPNLLGFASSVGIYRNKRIRDLRLQLCKNIHRKVDFADLAPMLFQTAMAYAAENQIDGDFSSYSSETWREIFLVNHVQVSLSEASAIKKALEEVGLFDHGKIRSWAKFNRHLADYEGIVRAKRKASKMAAQKRSEEAKKALHGGDKNGSETHPKPEKNGSENGSASKQLWLIETALKSAKGKAKKELLAQKQALLEGATGVDLSEPAPRPPAPAPKPRKQQPGEFERAQLKSARAMIEDGDYGVISEGMVKALIAAGDELPPELRSRFRRLLGDPEKEEPGNPVPG